MCCTYFGKYLLWNQQHTAGKSFIHLRRKVEVLWNVGEILPDFRKKYFTEMLVAVLLLALVLVIILTTGSAATRLLGLWV
jgi:hypothetical protein